MNERGLGSVYRPKYRGKNGRTNAMEMVGHKTESIYRRYAISDEASLKESAENLDALDRAQLPNFGESQS